jgi:solute carrier family 50 protein (sugar transporter)
MAESASGGFVELCGLLAPVLSIVVFASPIPTIRQIVADGKVGSYPLLPYTSIVASTFLWVVYGVLRREPKLWLSNGVGGLLGICYWISFVRVAPPHSPTLPGSVLQHVQALAALAAATVLICLFPLPPSTDPAPLIGGAAVVLCVAMFASPLAALRVVLETKSAKSIPWPFMLTSIANCFSWTVYGIFSSRDPNIYVPNVLGLMFGLTQLGLKITFDCARGDRCDKKDDEVSLVGHEV